MKRIIRGKIALCLAIMSHLSGCVVAPESKETNMLASNLTKSDPELIAIRDNFLQHDLRSSDALTDTQKMLVCIASLSVQQMLPQLQVISEQALALGVSPLLIRETVYLSAAFVGFPRTENAINAVNQVFKRQGIALPLESAANVDPNQRYEQGLAIQMPIYGNEIKDAFNDLPAEFGHDVPRHLTELLFGDFYTRSGLDIQLRELVSLSILATLGAEKQLLSHVIGNIKVGNSKETLIAAMVQCLPYIGFPYMFNAINVIRQVDTPAPTNRTN